MTDSADRSADKNAYAESLLKPFAAPPSPQARRRMWAAVEAEVFAGNESHLRRQDTSRWIVRIGWRPFAAVAAAAVLLVIGLVQLMPSVSKRTTVIGPRTIVRGDARFAVGEMTEVAFEMHRDRTDVHLDSGSLEVAIESPAARPVSLHTTWATLEMTRGRFRARVRQDGLTADVALGTLRASWTAKERILRAGERIEIKRRGLGTTESSKPATGTPDTGTPDTETPGTGTPDTGPTGAGRRAPSPHRQAARTSTERKPRSDVRARARRKPDVVRRRSTAPTAPPTPPIFSSTVAATRPMPASAETLCAQADSARREGRWKEASALYGQVVSHPDGGPYAEEASLRQARLLARMQRPSEALVVLDQASRRFARGPLHPERTMLAIEIRLKRGLPSQAALAFQSLEPHRRASKQWPLRLRVARALFPSNRPLACAVVTGPPRGALTEAFRRELDAFIALRCKKKKD